jgi:hypothetical protein
MKATRLPQYSYEMNQALAKLAHRGSFGTSLVQKGGAPLTEELKKALLGCFAESEVSDHDLSDEFSAQKIETVVVRCRELLSRPGAAGECWREMSEFLEDEVWELSRLKEDLAQAEKEVRMVRMKLAEASSPQCGEVSQKRVMACAMLLAEKEMRCDHFQERVSMIIDGFVWRILDGLPNESGSEVLELRLRGVFGAL